ncbi:uncharacterized protein LOC131602280 [Vicia villosa]|uniref:uncharacterized protein LOC131602280 n=1 Tax=Vicia villosa TaxID=3911 RepID=UPI00273C7F62|nr:uncharacterized protein LOC131602280 [Vicia villosa]
MDDRNVKEGGGGEVDIESGLVIIEDDCGNTKIYCDFVGDSIKGDDRNSVVSMEMEKVTKLLPGKESVKSVESCLVKEKRKKSGNKKAAKPPRAPRGPSLDAADQKLIREITQLAMLKRARVERMKALKKMKAAKSLSPAPSSGVFSMVLTVVFCIVILLQGMSSSSGKSSVTSFQGSPVSAGGSETEAGLIAVQLQHHLNPSSIEHGAPSLESHKIVHGSYLHRKLR